MKPIIAFHKDADGNLLDAKATEWSHELDNWMRALSVRPGDTITFSEKAVRRDAEVEPQAIDTSGSVTAISATKTKATA